MNDTAETTLRLWVSHGRRSLTAPSCLSGGQQVVTRPEGGAGAIGDADPPEDVAEVDLDGALGDAQPAADLLVGQSLCHEQQHLALARAEVRTRGVPPPGEQRPGDPRIQRRVAAGSRSQRG